MIILRTPKGWTGPKFVDGVAGRRGRCGPTRSPSAEVRTNPAHLAQLEEWMRSYRPEELFDEDGPPGARDHRRGAGGRATHERHPARQRRSARCSDLELPDWADYAVEVKAPGTTLREATSACSASSSAT